MPPNDYSFLGIYIDESLAFAIATAHVEFEGKFLTVCQRATTYLTDDDDGIALATMTAMAISRVAPPVSLS